MQDAAKNGHLKVVQWLFYNQRPSLAGGHPEVVQWLDRKGCKRSF